MDEPHPLASLGHGSLLTLMGQVFLVGATFGARVILVRYLSPLPHGIDQLGWLFVGIAMSGLIANLGSLGLPSAMARQLAHTTALRERWALVGNALLLTLPAAGLTGALVYLSAPWLAKALNGSPLVFQLLAVSIAFGIVAGVLTAFFQGNEDALPNTLFNQILNPCLILGFLLAFLAQNATLNSALWAYVTANAVTLGAIVLYTLGPRGFPWRRGDRATVAPSTVRRTSTVGSLLLFSVPLAFIGFASASVGTADTFVLAAFNGPQGTYTTVLPLSRLVALAVGALGYMMLPVAARLHRLGDMPELARSYATITKWIVAASLPFFLTFFFLPGQSLVFVFGASFLASAGTQSELLLQITCVAGILVTVLGPAPSVLVGLGKLRLLVIDTVIAAGADLGLSVVLVPLWGSVGAAVAFSVATALLPALCVSQTYLLARVHPFTRAVARPTLAVLVPAVVALGVLTGPLRWNPHPVWLAPLFLTLLLAYLLAIPLTRSIEAGDHHLLRVVEGYLGRPLTFVRRTGRKFVPPGFDDPPAASALPPQSADPECGPSPISTVRPPPTGSSSRPPSEDLSIRPLLGRDDHDPRARSPRSGAEAEGPGEGPPPPGRP